MPRYVAFIRVLLDEPNLENAVASAQAEATRICDWSSTDCAKVVQVGEEHMTAEPFERSDGDFA